MVFIVSGFITISHVIKTINYLPVLVRATRLLRLATPELHGATDLSVASAPTSGRSNVIYVMAGRDHRTYTIS